MLGFHDEYFAVSEFVQCFCWSIINHFTNFILPETMNGWMVRFTHTALHMKHKPWWSVNNSVYLKICQKAKQSETEQFFSLLLFWAFSLIWNTVWFVPFHSIACIRFWSIPFLSLYLNCSFIHMHSTKNGVIAINKSVSPVDGMMCWYSVCIHEVFVVIRLSVSLALLLFLLVYVFRLVRYNAKLHSILMHAKKTTENMSMERFIVLFRHSNKNARNQCNSIETISLLFSSMATSMASARNVNLFQFTDHHQRGKKSRNEMIFVWFYYSLLFHFWLYAPLLLPISGLNHPSLRNCFPIYRNIYSDWFHLMMFSNKNWRCIEWKGQRNQTVCGVHAVTAHTPQSQKTKTVFDTESEDFAQSFRNHFAF